MGSLDRVTLQITQAGVELHYSGPYFVYENNITNNFGFGLQFGENCNNALIYNNNIAQNEIGIRLLNFDGYPFGTGNIVYNNNLVDNSANAFVEHSFPYDISYINNGTDSVSWDNRSVGNYWSDYSGHGTYVIDQNNTDYFPLMHPIDFNTIAPTPTPSSSTEGWIPQLTIPIIVVVILAIAVLSVLLYRKHRKTANLSK